MNDSCNKDNETLLTLDEAIAHAEEKINDTSCGRQHKQLADWLKELRELKQAPVSNGAAMHKALENLRDEASFNYDLHDYPIAGAPGERGMAHCVDADTIIDEVNSALAAPPRNCDVGTVEEQAERYKATGVVFHTLTLSNVLKWAQMPYEEGGAE